jgi:hypothetical protein
MDKNSVRLLKVGEETVIDDFVPGTMAERIKMVWTLTAEVASLTRKYDVEQRLQRDVTVLKRRES